MSKLTVYNMPSCKCFQFVCCISRLGAKYFKQNDGNGASAQIVVVRWSVESNKLKVVHWYFTHTLTSRFLLPVTVVIIIVK